MRHLTFPMCLVLFSMASSAQAQERTYWKHEGGYFMNTGGGDWTEKSQNGTFYLREAVRTAPYIELVSKSGSGTRIRLHAKQSDILRLGVGKWEIQYQGGWEAAAAAAKERVVWRHDGGFFENTKGNDWFEKSPNGTFHFREIKRKEDYIELENVKSGNRLRLLNVRCIAVNKDGEETKEYYRGGWE